MCKTRGTQEKTEPYVSYVRQNTMNLEQKNLDDAHEITEQDNKWWESWVRYVEETARKEGIYHYPLAQKQDTDPANAFWSSVEFKEGYWWQTIYDANKDHALVITKKYERYVDAVEDFSIYPNSATAEFAYQASFY